MFTISPAELEEKAFRIRRDLIDLHYRIGSGHLDTCLSLVEIWLSIVYSDFFRFDPQNGAWEERDRVFLSEGHACPLQYLISADLGYTTRESVFTGIRKPGTPFQGHTVRNLKYGLENSNGSLGVGVWHAYGHALVTDRLVFCIAGDGEFQEPSSIGLLTAPLYLRPAPNLILMVNNNRLAQDSKVELGPIDQMGEIYGWQVQHVNGHSFAELSQVCHNAVAERSKPSLIVCETVKGKGGDPASEGRLGFHGRPPKDEKEYQAHLAGLEATRRK